MRGRATQITAIATPSRRRRIITVLLLGTLSACSSGPGPAPAAGGGSPAATPSAAADLAPLRVFTVLSSFTVDQLHLPLHAVPEGTGAICGPHYGLQIDRTGTTARFDADHTIGINPVGVQDGPAYPVQAPDGKEFVVVHSVFTTCGGDRSSGAPDSTVLRLGQRSTPVDPIVLSSNQLLVVLVDRGVSAALEVTDGGQTQTLDLRTGKAGGTVAGYQPVATGSASFTGSVGQDVILSATVTAELHPYLDGHGQAPKGHCWLRIDTGYSYQGEFKPPGWSVQQIFTVSGPTGKLAVTGSFTVLKAATSTNEQTVLTSPWVVFEATCERGLRLSVTFHPTGVRFREFDGKLTRALVVR